MHDWLESSLAKLSKKSATSAAIRYAHALWGALVRFCDDGRIEIDNNAAERALRCVAIGRKNYLFAGSDRGGERAATFYSLIGSAKLNGLDPEAYLRELLTRIADHPVNRIRRASALEPRHRPGTHLELDQSIPASVHKWIRGHLAHTVKTARTGGLLRSLQFNPICRCRSHRR
jgi:Transposase IS66 family/IS66 C-terminal element